MQPNSVAALSALVKDRLARAGVAAPALDARLIIMRATGLTHEALVASPEQHIAPDALRMVLDMAERREGGEPVSRMLGEREFYGRIFALNSGTLDPRPETEMLVEAGLRLLRDRTAHAPRIADLGTGSGAVIVTLLAELPDASGVGIDLSTNALEAAKLNALRHKVANRLALVQGSWFENLSGVFDLIVANPPYVASGDIAELPREVRLHDPQAALDGGPDGLAAYREIARDARRHLRLGGHLCLEIGKGQEAEVGAMMCESGLRPARGYPAATADLSGIPRVLTFVND